MGERCPECNGPVKVGYLMPDDTLGPRFILSKRAGGADAELAIRKTKRCIGCGFEPVGIDAAGTPPGGGLRD